MPSVAVEPGLCRADSHESYEPHDRHGRMRSTLTRRQDRAISVSGEAETCIRLQLGESWRTGHVGQQVAEPCLINRGLAEDG
jgi:hypothetical protein